MSNTKLEELQALFDERKSFLYNKFKNKAISLGIIEIGENIIFLDTKFIENRTKLLLYNKDFSTFDLFAENGVYFYIDVSIIKGLNEHLFSYISHIHKVSDYKISNYVFLKYYDQIVLTFPEQQSKATTDLSSLEEVTKYKLKDQEIIQYIDGNFNLLLYQCHKQHPQGFTFEQWIDFLQLNPQPSC